MRAIYDALNVGAYHDDRQMVSIMIDKYYSDQPRVEIVIEEIEEGKD